MPAIFRSDFTGTPDYMNWNKGMSKGSYMRVPDLRDPSGFRTVDSAGNDVKNTPPGADVSDWTGGNYFPNSAGGSGATSVATGGAVGMGGGSGGGMQIGNQLKQIRDDFRRMKEMSLGAINEDLAARGTFSSGVGGKIASDERSRLDLQQMSAEERLMNDMLARNFEMEMARSRGSGGDGYHYGNANANQAAAEAAGISTMGGARFGNSNRGGGGMIADPAFGGGGAAGGGGMKVGDTAWKAQQARYKALDNWRAGLGPHPDTGEWKVGNSKTGQSRDTGFGGWADVGF